MPIEKDLFSSVIKGALSAHFDDLVKSISPVGELPQAAHEQQEKELEENKAKREEQAFDKPTEDENEEIEVLAYWSLEHRQKVDNLTIQKTQEEIYRIRCENDEVRAKTRNNHAVARGRRIDNRLRLQMAAATFKFMQYWCGFVALIVFLYVAKHDGKPEKEIIIALLGTSTISIVGLVGFVVSGLFKSNKDKDT
ncbi:hypothetical protein [Enterobacter roggenkampii]|uniref:hypothetical protein n=1 Tax=Enterobacter roggenkampii TaxID=1812935 RepID=UPI002DBB8E62|nr:hypothetical protein [Enterobacter roggenkampii]MEB5886818.1 hypothetical protein [Enterobacter roggenkampii]